MDSRSKPPAPETAADEAATWLLRLQDKGCTEQERAQFKLWLRADEAHVREYKDLLEVWIISGQLEPTMLELSSDEDVADRLIFATRQLS